MQNSNSQDIVISGLGVISSVGQGKSEFGQALMAGQSSFSVLKREYRQENSSYLGAEIGNFNCDSRISSKLFAYASLSGQLALSVLAEAWDESKLDEVDGHRIGLIVGGSNVQQRELFKVFKKYANKKNFIRPNYAVSFLDSDICGLCTEQFKIKGLAFTAGGASASGMLAIHQAVELVKSGVVDICIALGAMMDLSYLELQAFRAIGAMGSDNFSDNPSKASRPFDVSRDGFIYGESSGALVIERAESAKGRGLETYARIAGCSINMDANRNPNPSQRGEIKAIKDVLRQANLKSNEIDYVNPHGTGSPIGDKTELAALSECDLLEAYMNTTKSIIGHGLSSAGVVETIATILQMKCQILHPSRNLDDPIDSRIKWVNEESINYKIQNALKLGFGFGGINMALCLNNLN